MDPEVAFQKLIESYRSSQLLKTSIQTELEQLKVSILNKGSHIKAKIQLNDLICCLYVDTVCQKLFVANNCKIQEEFEFQSKLAALDESIKSVAQEIALEASSKAEIQATLSKKEEEAAELQRQNLFRREVYSSEIEVPCRLYMKKRKDFFKHLAEI